MLNFIVFLYAMFMSHGSMAFWLLMNKF